MSDSDGIKRDLAERKAAQSCLAETFNPTGLSVVHSFDLSTRDGVVKLLAATNGEQEQLESLVNKDILLSDFYAHEVESADEHGEISRWIRVVVFDENGTPYQCGSIGVRKSIGTIMQIRRASGLKPPVKCTVMQQRTGNKNLFMFLKPDIDSLLAGKHG